MVNTFEDIVTHLERIIQKMGRDKKVNKNTTDGFFQCRNGSLFFEHLGIFYYQQPQKETP